VAAVFQAKSCETTFERKLCFNGPRAGINLNNGFGGGSSTSQNLTFNFCRESALENSRDHGPINSWNKQPYVAGLPGTAVSAHAIRALLVMIVSTFLGQIACDSRGLVAILPR
jgi:hypothetical protein